MTSTVTFPRSGPPARVLVVDDDEPIRRSLVRVLGRAGYECAAASDAVEARRLLSFETFDLMLCDVTMPGESGFSLLAHSREVQPSLAVIMVTASNSPDTFEPAVRFGAYGRILKPFDTNMLLINVVGALRQRAERIAENNKRLQTGIDVEGRLSELGEDLERLAQEDLARSTAREESVRHVALAAEWRNPDTPNHLERISAHVARLAGLAGLTSQEVEDLRLASQLHDVGKLGIPDAVVLKSKLLTADERLIMQGHTEVGFKMLEGSASPLLRLGSIVALSHHERFDGNGYPHGLKGSAIPLEARIVAIADVFDALRSQRPYKQAYSQNESLEILRVRRRAQLDPELLDLFIGDLEARPSI